MFFCEKELIVYSISHLTRHNFLLLNWKFIWFYLAHYCMQMSAPTVKAEQEITFAVSDIKDNYKV